MSGHPADDIAEIDANPRGNALFVCLRLPIDSALDHQCAIDGIDHASKFE
jgi:hypothetical protein